MRLIQSRFKTVPLSRLKTAKSGYIGTEVTYIPMGDIKAEIQPVSALAQAEKFGISISRGILIFCELGTDIKERDRVRWQDTDYSVKGVLQHNNILRVEAEKVEP